jgi:PAS domain S-box-containing protein
MSKEQTPGVPGSPQGRCIALGNNRFDFICEIDAEGRLSHVSANHEAFFGRSVQAIMAAPVSEMVHPDDRSRVIDVANEAFRSGESARVTLRVIGRDERVRWIECTISPFETLDSTTHAVLLSRDITESKRLEENLRASRERFRLISDSAYDMIAEYDMSENLLYANDRTREVLGYASEDLQDRPPHFFVHPEDLALTRGAFARVRSGEAPRAVVTYRGGRHDGTWCWIEANICAVTPVDGEPRMLMIARDVSQHVEAEQRLRESEERYRQLVESSPVGILVIQGHKIAFSNQAGAEICGAPEPRELTGTDILDLVELGDADALDVQLARARARMPAADTMEVRICGLDGRIREVLGTGRMISYRGAPAYQGIIRDITELRRAEREQKRLELQLQEARKLESLGVLAGGIAHDFNNLLAVILSNVRFARQAVAGQPELDDALGDTVEAAESAARLTGQLLAYAGRRSPAVRSVDLSQLVQENSALLGSAVQSDVELAFELAQDVLPVHADAVQLEQVVMNLVINGAEAIGNRAGTITVATGRTDATQAETGLWVGGEGLRAGEYAYLEVRDTGCGMDAATRERIFEPFFTTKSQGHGLGLSAVLGLVRGHGGAISLRTEPGRGTALCIHFPVSDDPIAYQIDPINRAAELCNASVLVVEGERDLDREATRVLRDGGVRVVEAVRGDEAVVRARLLEDEIDVGLIDLESTSPSGVDIALELRALRPDLPLLLTGEMREVALARHLANEAPAEFLHKPYREAALLEHLRILLGKQSADGAAPETG